MEDSRQIKICDAVEAVMAILEERGFSPRALSSYRSAYRRLSEIAAELGEDRLGARVVGEFVERGGPDDVGGVGKGRQARERSARYLRCFAETGEVDFSRRGRHEEPALPRGLASSLAEFDERQAAKGLAPGTLAKYHLFARHLLGHLASLGRENLESVRPGDVTDAIEAIARDHCTPATLYSALPGIRAFCRAFDEMAPFACEIPGRLPKASPPLEVLGQEERFRLSEFVRSGAVSKRDEAICLLSLETGLRSSDVCGLKVGDVDWRHDLIHIVQSKTGRAIDLPLRPSYGNAIAAYLLHERPESAEAWLFLASKAPHGKLTTVGDIIGRAAAGAGIGPCGHTVGSRMLRHSAASAMLREGSPLPTIAGLLGHASPDTTMIYITTQGDDLAALTLPLPGAVI